MTKITQFKKFELIRNGNLKNIVPNLKLCFIRVLLIFLPCSRKLKQIIQGAFSDHSNPLDNTDHMEDRKIIYIFYPRKLIILLVSSFISYYRIVQVVYQGTHTHKGKNEHILFDKTE